MKKIAITGGKGGTGKSTMAILLANKFLEKGKKVVLGDLDVECPNDYLLLGQKLGQEVKKVYTEFPKLNKAKCTKCGLCSQKCPSNAIFQAPGKYPIFIKDLCSGCGLCAKICPYKAITMKKETSGVIYKNQIKRAKKQKISSKKESKESLYLITGQAKAGLEETAPIVAETKKFALDFAKKHKFDIVIFDTAPGIHCLVIRALLDVDLAYAVTEPTPLGAHDLALILDLSKKLKIKTKVILNQSDLGNKEEIISVLQKFNIKDFAWQVPYSYQIVEAYSQGKLLDLKIK